MKRKRKMNFKYIKQGTFMLSNQGQDNQDKKHLKTIVISTWYPLKGEGSWSFAIINGARHFSYLDNQCMSKYKEKVY